MLPAVVLALVPLVQFDAWRWWLVAGWLILSACILLPQRFCDEDRHPLTRFLRWAYRPLFSIGMSWPRSCLLVAAGLVAVTFVGPFQKVRSGIYAALGGG